MKMAMKCTAATVIVILGISLIVYLVFLWRGVFDSGTFEVKQNLASSQGKVAILARRSSVEALSGNEYFVIISDHLNSPVELRRALHSSLPVFIADRDGINLEWIGPNELLIRCENCGITRERIEVQKSFYNGSTIRYTGFP
jgi:hypothetical protein